VGHEDRRDVSRAPRSDARRGDDGTARPLFWVALVAGWGLIGFGIWTVLGRPGATTPIAFAAWFVGLALVHDLVVAPAISAIAGLAGRRLRPPARGWVLGASIVSGALVLVSLPPLLGDAAGNDTLLPRDEAAGLAVALALVWAIAISAIVLTRVRGRR
jgi:hypothetical protein